VEAALSMARPESICGAKFTDSKQMITFSEMEKQGRLSIRLPPEWAWHDVELWTSWQCQFTISAVSLT
jgi:hypothetical protein